MTTTSLLAGTAAAPSGDVFRATDAATGQPLDPPFHTATPADVDRAARLAADAAPAFAATSGAERAALLRRIADRLDAAADALVDRAHLETALPEPRLRGELGRTTGQLRLFASVAEGGAWRDVRIDRADPDRQPAPRPDVRSMRVPRGPVAVFGASNFPLAFSVAGGDTASALAVGCPVVAKAHPAHPGTSALAGAAVAGAVAAGGLPAGVFSLVLDGGQGAGLALVRHPAIAAVGFTGSRRGGLALVDEAARRAVPIPVFAEMGSVNPFFVLPAAVEARGRAVAEALAGSVALGVGQFCTCPGLVFLVDGPGADAFVETLAGALGAVVPAPMLTPGIARAYREGVDRIEALAPLAVRVDGGGTKGGAALAVADAATFLAAPALAEETFGPATTVVRCPDADALLACARSLDGQLTAALHLGPGDDALAQRLLPLLTARAGRVLFNGVPTGVEVSHAQVHGGPFPATSDGGSTSVGTRAAERWTRLLAFQDAPAALLPAPLRDGNPEGLPRLVDGVWER